MKKIDRLLMKARKVTNRIKVFLPFVVPGKEIADRVSMELDEFCGDKPYHAVIIYGENELSDDADGVAYDHVGDDLKEGE